jgi:hypothetical protein
MNMMSQFKAEIPHPLREDLPEFLSTGSVGTPTIRILFLIFVGEDGLE